MRSYWDHLKTQENKNGGSTFQHPQFRSSALFPVLQTKELSTRLIYLGYWLVKRNIPSIGNVVTLRNKAGRTLFREFNEITLPKCYRIELADLLKKASHSQEEDFEGSIEVEFYSAKPLVFPFPAVTINYYGSHFSSVVHSAERVYNDFDDRERNQKNKVKESGFDLHVSEDTEPFFALSNGPEKVDDILEIQAINHQNQDFILKVDNILAPYETRFFYPARMMPLKEFMEGKTGTMKIRVSLPWVFPRLLAGNRNSGGAMILTHTYYDSTECDAPQDFWLKQGESWYSAALMLPLRGKDFENSISIYPIYSPSPFKLAAEIYDMQGTLLSRTENFFLQDKDSIFQRISLNPLIDKLPKQDFYSLRLSAEESSLKPIPTRIKIAINIGSPENLPCNICTNLQPYYPEWESKKRSFRWLPLLFDQKGAKTFIMNSSPLKNYQESVLVRITLYREKDDAILKREVQIPPNGFIVLSEDDEELKDFLQGNIGWAIIESENPYLITYYFVFHPSGTVGGDHGY